MEVLRMKNKEKSNLRTSLWLVQIRVKKDVSQEIRTTQAWVPRISPKEACCSSQGKRYGLSASWGIYFDAEKCANWGRFQKSVQLA
ncbi:hypothetical protein U1Q18_020338 [Sarracenia purpurea var. burkii]